MLNVWTPAQQGGQMDDISSKDAEQAVNRFQEKLYQAIAGVSGSGKLMQFGKGVHRLLCTHVQEQNERVKTFTFVGPEVGCWSFEPGQFFTFEVPCAQGIVRRSYSISSSPYQPYAIEVTVKRLDEGIGSVWLHEHMQPGREIVAHGPHGQFSILPSLHKPKIAFFAAGVGITPLMSMMQCLSQGKHELDAVLLNRVHSYEDVIFSAELQSLKDIRQITISTNNEGQWPKALGLLQDPGARQITPTLIESLIPDIQERTVYLCGPHSFKDSVLACLEFLNFDKTQFFSESFGGIHQPGKHLLNSDGANALGGILEGYLKLLAEDIPTEELCEVAFSRSGKTARCAMGDNLLEVAQFNGVSISSSCKTGACGTCKCTLLEGSVEMNNPTGLSESDRAAGQILACVAYANNRKIVLDV
jgi:ferredoxin-NADP reductase